jgi:GYF domain 2
MSLLRPTSLVAVLVAAALLVFGGAAAAQDLEEDEPGFARTPPPTAPAPAAPSTQPATTTTPPSSQPASAPAASQPSAPTPPPATGRSWFYQQGSTTKGPVTNAELRWIYGLGRVQADTLVYPAGPVALASWGPLALRPGLHDLVDWYIVRRSGRLGPLKTTQVVQRIRAGQLRRGSRVWRRGLLQALPLSSSRVLAGYLRGAAKAVPSHQLDGDLDSAMEDEVDEGEADRILARAQRGSHPGDDASSGRAIIGRCDVAGSAYIESHFYALDTESDVNAGRLLLGARVPVIKSLVLGAELSIPWVTSSWDEDQVAFGNMALLADVRLFGSRKLKVLLALKLHLPTLGDDSSSNKAAAASFSANPYEPGFYFTNYMTIRPDFKLNGRLGKVVLGGEIGFDFLIPTEETNQSWAIPIDPFMAVHFGFRVGGLFVSDRLFPYMELAIAKLVRLEESQGGYEDSYRDDPSLSAVLGLGIKLQFKYFEAGVAVLIPLTSDQQDLVDAGFALQLGGRW